MSEMNENKITPTHLTEYQLSIAADALMSGRYDTLSKDITSHLEVCSVCKAELLALTDLLTQMDTQITPESEPLFQTEEQVFRKWNWLRWTAAALIPLLIIVSVLLWQNLNRYKEQVAELKNTLNQMDNRQNSQIEDSLNSVIKLHQSTYDHTINHYTDSLNKLKQNLESSSHLLAEAYKEYQPFEEQIGMNLRSTSFKIITPLYAERSYGETVYLRWESEKSTPMSMVVYNNKGTMVLKEKTGSSSFSFKSTVLLPGVYYWKLVDEEEVVSMGKIVLK